MKRVKILFYTPQGKICVKVDCFESEVERFLKNSTWIPEIIDIETSDDVHLWHLEVLAFAHHRFLIVPISVFIRRSQPAVCAVKLCSPKLMKGRMRIGGTTLLRHSNIVLWFRGMLRTTAAPIDTPNVLDIARFFHTPRGPLQRSA